MAVWVLVGCGETASGPEHPGKKTYNRYCFSCHAGGIAGSPALGDVDAWALRLEKGRDALVQSVINGITPGMPARGLCNACSDEQLGLAVDYMLTQLPPP